MSAPPSRAVTLAQGPAGEPVSGRGAPRWRHRRIRLADSDAVLGHAAELVAAVETEISDLWRDTIDRGDLVLSERLVALSHGLRRASLVLEGTAVIGGVDRTPSRRLPRFSGLDSATDGASTDALEDDANMVGST
jgi:hypothetical protein